MTHAQLIAAMLEAAAPVIESYWTDCHHDARLIADAAPGSTFLWVPRKMGTFVVLLQREGKPNSRAAATFSAMQGADRQPEWRLLTIGQDNSAHMDTLTSEDAAVAAWEATRRAEQNPANAVSELHM